MNDFHDRDVEDATGHKNEAICENAVTLGPPIDPSTNADRRRSTTGRPVSAADA